jgi:uroporphyrinogen-III synthase
VPTVAFEPVDPSLELRPALAALSPRDWLVVTSPRGARVVAPEVATLRRSHRPRLAVIGPATAQVLADAGLAVAAVAAEASTAALVAAVAGRADLGGRTVLVARSDAAGSDLPSALASLGTQVRSIVSYRMVIGPSSSRRPLQDALAAPALRVVHFASGSAVRGALALAGREASRLRELRLVTLGPATTTVAQQAGLEVCAEAVRPDVASQLAAVQTALSAA